MSSTSNFDLEPTMENILGLLEDMLDKSEKGSPEEKEDVLHTLQQNQDQFMTNLTELIENGNSDAQKIYERLKKMKF